jgi:lysophospholipase L1-like esterase
MSFFRRFSTLRTFAVVVSALVIALSAAIWFRMSHAEDVSSPGLQHVDSPYQPVPLAKVRRPTALFVGDDFTAGFGGIGRNGYPRIVCNAMQMNCNVDAEVGTGFVNDGRDFSSNTFRLIDRLPADEKIYAPDVVIIDAGRNDFEVDPKLFGNALEQYLRRVVRIWPASKVVVLAPSYLSAEAYGDYGTRISVIANAVQSVGAILIDPIAEQWYGRADLSTLLLPDSFHPNQAGHQFIADKLEKSLRDRRIGLEGPQS